MATIYGIVFICVEVLFVGICTFLVVKRKKIFDKNTIAFTIPAFIILLMMYITGWLLSDTADFTIYTFFNLFTNSLKGFKFEIKEALISNALENPVFNGAFIAACFIAGSSLILSVVSIFSVSFINFVHVKHRMWHEVDFVVGYNEDAITYCKNNRHCIMFINSLNHKLTKDDKGKLFGLKIPFIYRSFLPSYFSKIVIVPPKANFIVFEDTSSLHYVYDFLNSVDSESKMEMNFYVLTDEDNTNFISDQVTEKCKGKKNLLAYVLNRHELLARNFSLNHNIAYYLPRSFFDGVTIKRDKKIIVNIIGCGKTGLAVLKSLIINNQFVSLSEDGKKFESHKVTYNLFDKDGSKSRNKISAFIQDYDKINYNSEIESPESPADIFEHKFDVNTDFANLHFSTSEDEFVITIVCLSKSIYNCELANSLSKALDLDKNIIFYNIDFYSEIFKTHKNVIPFGFKSTILDHNIIVNDNLGMLADLNNKEYWKLKDVEHPENFHSLPLIRKMSNIYSNLNMRFKLNLLNLDMTNDQNAVGLSEKEFAEYYPEVNYTKYEQYFEINKWNALAYQEHLRWCAFYILNGYTTMKPSDFKFEYYEEDGKQVPSVITKNEHENKHGCLTTYYELDKVHKKIFDIYVQNCVKKEMFGDVETYRYDLSLMNKIYKMVSLIDYKIVKKNQ